VILISIGADDRTESPLALQKSLLDQLKDRLPNGNPGGFELIGKNVFGRDFLPRMEFLIDDPVLYRLLDLVVYRHQCAHL
jgi:hypothetical protein